jgi:hypothetical protein
VNVANPIDGGRGAPIFRREMRAPPQRQHSGVRAFPLASRARVGALSCDRCPCACDMANPFSNKRRRISEGGGDPRRWSIPEAALSTGTAAESSRLSIPDGNPRRWSLPAAPTTAPIGAPPITPTLSLGRRLLPTPSVPPLTGRPTAVACPACIDDIEEVSEDEIQEDEEGSCHGFAIAAAAPLGSSTRRAVPPPPTAAAVAPAPDLAAATRTLPLALPPSTPAALPPPRTSSRSSFVLGLSLRNSQLGETTGVRAGRTAGIRRTTGVHSALVQRAASEVSAVEQLLLVKHRILGPTPPTKEALRAALADDELRHRILRLRRVHVTAPLVIAECDDGDSGDEAGDGSPTPSGDASGGVGSSSSASTVRVVMQRAKFERACGRGGDRFVIFGPWIERHGAQLTILATHAEALM